MSSALIDTSMVHAMTDRNREYLDVGEPTNLDAKELRDKVGLADGNGARNLTAEE